MCRLTYKYLNMKKNERSYFRKVEFGSISLKIRSLTSLNLQKPRMIHRHMQIYWKYFYDDTLI